MTQLGNSGRGPLRRIITLKCHAEVEKDVAPRRPPTAFLEQQHWSLLQSCTCLNRQRTKIKVFLSGKKEEFASADEQRRGPGREGVVQSHDRAKGHCRGKWVLSVCGNSTLDRKDIVGREVNVTTTSVLSSASTLATSTNTCCQPQTPIATPWELAAPHSQFSLWYLQC